MYTQKDYKRIAGILANPTPLAGAERMAKSIKDKHKALQRGNAATALNREDVAKVFFDRAEELGVDVNTELSRVKRVLGSELPFDEQFKSTRRISGGRGAPILPCGVLNLRTGENKYFNVKTSGERTIEVWRTDRQLRMDKPKYRFVITSGARPLTQMGNKKWFQHDQNRTPLFRGELVDYINADSMELLIEKYGNRYCYVYK